jgi:ABC-type lipoprotein release transport system permease subunit
MTIGKLWVIAFRDLGRNRRRSFLTGAAVAVGTALTIVMAGYISGMLYDTIQNGIRLQTSHVQIRDESYVYERLSLLPDDLLIDTSSLETQVSGLAEVNAATPVLWASGVLSTLHDTVGLQVYGIDPASPIHDHIREGMVSGEYIATDDRGGILMGKSLADDLEIGVGQRVSLMLGNADGQPEEGIFTIRGLFDTEVPSYDENTIFMPLSKAQAFTRNDGHASAILIMLRSQEEAEQVATALKTDLNNTLTWEEMNSILLETVQQNLSFYYILYLIVMLVVAVVVANTLLMAVFERTREIGILASLGMKRGQIILMILLEAAALALLGVAAGIVLGTAGTLYLQNVGIYFGDIMGGAVSNIPLGSRLYSRLVPADVIGLAIGTLVITLLASLYPAWFASRMEPVEALRSAK